MTSGRGAPVETADLSGISNPSGSSNFQYAGYYYHAPSGLNLTTFRAYNPTLGRWINRDPIGEDGGVNLYDYCFNDPVNLLDPQGLFPSVLGGDKGAIGKKCNEKLPCVLKNHFPSLTDAQAAKLAKAICKKFGNKDLIKGVKVAGLDYGRVMKDASSYAFNSAFGSKDAATKSYNDIVDMLPKEVSDLTPAQVNTINDFLGTLPADVNDAVTVVKTGLGSSP